MTSLRRSAKSWKHLYSLSLSIFTQCMVIASLDQPRVVFAKDVGGNSAAYTPSPVECSTHALHAVGMVFVVFPKDVGGDSAAYTVGDTR